MAEFKVLLQGQDISSTIREETLKVEDTLAQGAGTGGGGSTGRAATCTFVTALGPAAQASGAGQVPFPNLLSAQQSDILTPDVSGFKFGLGAGGSIAQDTSQFWHGSASLRVIADGTATFQSVSASINAATFIPGVAYTFSAYLKASAGQTPNLRFFAEGNDLIAGNARIGNSVTATPTSGGWTRYTVTATIPKPNPYSIIGIRIDTGGTAQAITFYLDGLQIEQGKSVTAWRLGGGNANPVLARNGLVQVFDGSGVNIFTGRAVKLNDKTDKINPWTEVTCNDLWQEFSRVVVNQAYTNQTDTAIITSLLSIYAPDIDTSGIGAPSLVIPSMTFQEINLQQAIQQVADITGYQVSVTPLGKMVYQSLSAAQTSPFSLSDTNVDGSSVCGLWVDSYQQDDASAINRVVVRGGTIHSQDFTQDMSNQVTASNLTFIFAYRPHHAADGKIHLTANGVELLVGYANTTDALKKNGGTFDALVDQDQKVAQLNAVPATPFLAIYQYTAPLVLTVTDPASHDFYGEWLDGTVNDSQITDIPTGLVRGRAVLAQQSFGLVHFSAHTRKYGLSSGMMVRVDHYKRGIHGTFQIQKVTYESQGRGIFHYALELGAWQWNMVDVLMQVSRAIFAENVDLNPAEETVTANVLAVGVTASVAVTASQRTPGGYYARTAPLGDGHDAYAGLFTITS